MKIIIAICFIVLVGSARGHNGVYRSTDRFNDTCEKPTTAITRVRQGDPSLFYNKAGDLRMKFYRDTSISPNAFSTLEPAFVYFEMPHTNERNKSALHTLTLHSDSFVGWSNVRSITIMHANINLCKGTLTSITNLQCFRFKYCGFTEVPTEMLKSAPNLIELSFESNYIGIIHPNAFLTLKSLRELYLQDNGIISLELGCFNGLDNLLYLRLSDNHFTAVASIFNGLTKLTYLNIGNAFDDNGVNYDILQNKPSMTHLNMTRNNIISLKPNMFDIVPQLKVLSLFSNLITSVPKGVFMKLKSLKSILLGYNNIKTIESGAFSGLKLRHLVLSHNEVEKIIETGTFNNVAIEYLTLGHNHITELKPRAFDGVKANKLRLNNNKLKQIGANDFLGLDTEVLDLSDNKIETITPNAFKNTKVKKLYLAGNPIHIGEKGNWGLPESTAIII